jgi:hypothetical protein
MMLIKYSLAFTSLALFTGCATLSDPAKEPVEQAQQAGCFVKENDLHVFLDDEHTFILADKQQKKALIEAFKHDTARQANLLSSEISNKTALRSALGLFKQLPLLPSKTCYADRYLYLRFRQTQANLRQLESKDVVNARYADAKKTIAKLQEQIDALTEIEQAITRQREEH